LEVGDGEDADPISASNDRSIAVSKAVFGHREGVFRRKLGEARECKVREKFCEQ
jgi:hypothetical protein